MSAKSARKPCPPIEPLEPRLLMAVIAVLNNNDGGAGSLRQAIADAVSGDTIDLSARTGTIWLGNDLTIDKALTIVGPGEGKLSITPSITGQSSSRSRPTGRSRCPTSRSEARRGPTRAAASGASGRLR